MRQNRNRNTAGVIHFRKESKKHCDGMRRPAGRHGFSLVELIISLAITACLLTATMVAIDASFKSYASAAELATTQATSRLMSHRLLALIRTSTAHGPLQPDPAATPPVILSGDTIESHYLELQSPNGDFVRIEYRSGAKELWAIITPQVGAVMEHPVMSGVMDAKFHAKRRIDQNSGLWVLERASIDLTIEPGNDSTLQIESGNNANIRIVASTMPRRLE